MDVKEEIKHEEGLCKKESDEEAIKKEESSQ
jgi:hypothetical protein